MGEQEVVLEHEADVPVFGCEAHICGRVLEHPSVDDDATPVEGDESGQGAQQGRLARAVGSDHGDDTLADVEAHIEVQDAEGDCDLGGEGHRVASHRSRRPIRTMNDTANMTRERARATPSLPLSMST